MPPRYRPGIRDPATEAARARVLQAARAVLLEARELTAFPMDVVAAKAGVARTIVHQQFRSPAGLLEALYDELIAQSKLADLPSTFRLDDPRAMTASFVAAFAELWEHERVPIRRLRALSTFDSFLGKALRAREQYRRETVQVLMRKLDDRGLFDLRADDDRLDALCALTSFEFLDAFAGPERAITEVVPAVQRMVAGTLASALPGRRARSL